MFDVEIRVGIARRATCVRLDHEAHDYDRFDWMLRK